MKKFAIVVIVLILGSLLAAVLIPVMRARDDSVPPTTYHMEAILFAMRYHAEHVGPLPTNGTAAIFSALRGSNPKSLAILADTDGQPDKMLDPWGQPYQILIHQDGTFQVTSSGSNGVIGDHDDIVVRSEPESRPDGQADATSSSYPPSLPD